jgi:hypothetical protein
MRIIIPLTALCLNSLFAFSQQSNLDKASPFTAVKWEGDQAVVQFKDKWYHFERLDTFSKEVILDFSKKRYGTKWQKRFSEDLIAILRELGHQPNTNVILQLSKNGIMNTYTGTLTAENRQQTLLYNRSIEQSSSVITFPQKISANAALADLRQFSDILQQISSYSQLSRFDYNLAIKRLADSLIKDNSAVDINLLTNEIAKIMSEIGDRHSSVKNEAFDSKKHKTYNLRLPFGLAMLNGKIIGLKRNPNSRNYNYFFQSYPFVKSVNGIAIDQLIDTYLYRDKKAPAEAKLSRGTEAIQRYGELLFKNNLEAPDSIPVVFSSGRALKSHTFHLTTADSGYSSRLSLEQSLNRNMINKHSYNGLSKILADHIGYINIPEMYNYSDAEGLENFIKTSFKAFSKTKALIIDIRNNPGGAREILQTFATYIVQARQSPWVANIAYLRESKDKVEDEESMSNRYLYSYHSKKLSDVDRQAIDRFNRDLKLEHTIDHSKFSSPYYMILHQGKDLYNRPVYILVNEKTFSAASVFASAFKYLPNVKIVGERTDGSSGKSEIMHLKNSNIKITVSTMLSFQRNGQTLDGNGTVPDLIIHEDEKQVLSGVDTQLDSLIKIINSSPIKSGL